MTETSLAPSAAEAAAATERLAAWVIGALTVIVVGGVALICRSGFIPDTFAASVGREARPTESCS